MLVKVVEKMAWVGIEGLEVPLSSGPLSLTTGVASRQGPTPLPAWPVTALNCFNIPCHLAKPRSLPPAVSQRANIYCPWKKKKNK